MTLGDRVKKLRKAKKLSVRGLASLAKVSKTTISETENNIVTNSTRGTLTKIADALGVPVGLLIEEENAMQEITDELMGQAQFKGSLSNLPEEEKREMIKDILTQEPQAFYETISQEGYIGPLSEDEMKAMTAYLKIYRESKKEGLIWQKNQKEK